MLIATLLSGGLVLFGIMLKNTAVAMLGVLGVLYFLGIFTTLPVWIWIIIAIIMASWILKGKY